MSSGEGESPEYFFKKMKNKQKTPKILRQTNKRHNPAVATSPLVPPAGRKSWQTWTTAVTQHQVMLHGKTNPICPKATRKCSNSILMTWCHRFLRVVLSSGKSSHFEQCEEKPFQTHEWQQVFYWATEQGIGRIIACCETLHKILLLKKHLIWEQTRDGTGCTSGREQRNVFPRVFFKSYSCGQSDLFRSILLHSHCCLHYPPQSLRCESQSTPTN